MFSVIIPTIWKGQELESMLPLVDNHPFVGEIILVNNAAEQTPDWFMNRAWKKLNIIDPGQNIFVNPAWNLAVKESQHDQLCFMSDDVMFDTKIFDFLLPIITESCGLVGTSMDDLHGDMNRSYPIRLYDCPEFRSGLGVLMFLHKSNFFPVPDQFKIFYGDNWLHEVCLRRNKMPRQIFGLPAKSKMETTSSRPEFREQARLEHERMQLDFFRVNSNK